MTNVENSGKERTLLCCELLISLPFFNHLKSTFSLVEVVQVATTRFPITDVLEKENGSTFIDASPEKRYQDF